MVTEKCSKYWLKAIKTLALVGYIVFLVASYRFGTLTALADFLFLLHLLFFAGFVVVIFQSEVSPWLVEVLVVLFGVTLVLVMGSFGDDSLWTLRLMGIGAMLFLSALFLWALVQGDDTDVSDVRTKWHLVSLTLALLLFLALVYSFHHGVAKLTKVPYSFGSTTIQCEDKTANEFLRGLMADRPSILQGVAVLTRPTSELDAPEVGELGLVPKRSTRDEIHWSSDICGDKYCIDQTLLGVSDGNGHTVSLQYRVEKSLEISELRVRVTVQNAETSSVCAVTLTNSSGM